MRALQAYLAGEEVDQAGFPSRIRWLDQFDMPKVPVDMACSGPRSIAMAGALADRISLTLGAAPERVRWGLEQARDAVEAAGRDPSTVSFGAYINTTVDDDRAAARDAIRGGVAVFTHFQGMKGNNVEEQPENLRRHSVAIQDSYDMEFHGQATAPHAQALDDDFIDWFGVGGPTGEVAERLGELVELGLDHLYMQRAPRPGSREAFAAEVLPALRA